MDWTSPLLIRGELSEAFPETLVNIQLPPPPGSPLYGTETVLVAPGRGSHCPSLGEVRSILHWNIQGESSSSNIIFLVNIRISSYEENIISAVKLVIRTATREIYYRAISKFTLKVKNVQFYWLFPHTAVTLVTLTVWVSVVLSVFLVNWFLETGVTTSAEIDIPLCSVSTHSILSLETCREITHHITESGNSLDCSSVSWQPSCPPPTPWWRPHSVKVGL